MLVLEQTTMKHTVPIAAYRETNNDLFLKRSDINDIVTMHTMAQA